MNTEFNTIEKIYKSKDIANSAAYLAACDSFEVEASKFANNESFYCRKCAEEVSLAYSRAKNADCAYSVYVAAHAAEKWLEKAWNNAD
jgi:hypothetical protein